MSDVKKKGYQVEMDRVANINGLLETTVGLQRIASHIIIVEITASLWLVFLI